MTESITLFLGVSYTYTHILISKPNYFIRTQHSLETDLTQNTENCKNLQETNSVMEWNKTTASYYITLFGGTSVLL